MNTRLLTISLLSIGLTACGGLEDQVGPSWNDPSETAGADPLNAHAGKPAVETSSLESCEIEPLWWTSEAGFRATPSHFEFTPDGSTILSGSDVFGSGHAAWSGADGTVLYLRSRNQIIDANRDQSRVLQRHFDGNENPMVVAPLGNVDDAIWKQEGPTVLADLDGMGKRVAYVQQHLDDTGAQHTYEIGIVDIDSGVVLHNQQITDSNLAWWAPYGPDYLAMSDDGRHVALGLVSGDWNGPAQPRVLLLSDRQGGWESTTVDVPYTPESERGYNGQISTVTFTPDSSELVVVSATGQVVRANTTTLAVTQGEPRGAFAANWDTYLPPLPSSPLLWTRDGRVQLSVAIDGALEVTHGETVLTRVVAAEESDAERFGWNPENNNPVIAAAVSPAGDRFAVAFRTGLGVWGCAGSQVTGTTDMRDVSVRPSRSAESPYRIDLDVMIDGAPRPIHGYTIFEDGDLRAQLGWDSPLTFYSATTEPVDVVVEVRDAFGVVRSQSVRVPAAE